jgi:multiple sugar transport system ATP-binding protein
MSTLKLKNLTKSYGKENILEKINLEVNSGEFLVLVGPSGCGKSTTLRLIAGLEEPTDGKIYIDSLLVNNVDPSNRDIAMVFQNYALYPQMTVKENMAFSLKIKKYKSDEIERRVAEAAKILQIESLMDRKPKELSGGQRQRVALGRAIVRRATVFLFDEPLSNLDAKLRQEMRLEIKRLHQLLNTTMIYVTHDQVEAMTMGDRIVVMNEGSIEQIGAPELIYRNPENIFTASFIGTPKINLVYGKLKKIDNRWYFNSDSLDIEINKKHYQYDNLEEGKSVLGIRSEHIHDSNSSDKNNPYLDLKAKVDFIEYLGSDWNIHFSIASDTFVARFSHNLESNQNININEQVDVYFNTMEAHFFNGKNGQLLK